MPETPRPKDELRRGIDESIARYRGTIRLTQSQHQAKLQQVITQAGLLSGTLGELDTGTRQAIIAPATMSRHAVDPHALCSQLRMLFKQAEHAYVSPLSRGTGLSAKSLSGK
jgi:hypothetical protein